MIRESLNRGKPEYVRNKILFPRVWAQLSEALGNRELLINGLDSQLFAHENSDETEELKRIEQQIEKCREREISYAEQRVDGSISKAIHKELVMRLRESKKELFQAKEQLKQKEKLINEAKAQGETA